MVKPSEIPRIGRGRNMSIAKAALVVYFNEVSSKYLIYGDLEAMHRIVDVAGANHVSFYTPSQVTSCLNNSPFWDSTFIPNFYKGIGNGHASVFQPSEKGKEYYERYLRDVL